MRLAESVDLMTVPAAVVNQCEALPAITGPTKKQIKKPLSN